MESSDTVKGRNATIWQGNLKWAAAAERTLDLVKTQK
jgi:hypothetical protein